MDINHPHHAAHIRITLILFAVALGVAFHFLVAERWYGIGLAVFFALFVIGMHVVSSFTGRATNAWAYVFLVPAVGAAFAEAAYASLVVHALGLPLIMLSSALFAYWFTAPRLGFGEAPSLWPKAWIAETCWPFRNLKAMTAGYGKTDKLRKVFFGLLIAAPAVIIIGILFIQADELFRKIVTDMLRIDLLYKNSWRAFRDIAVTAYFLALGWTAYTRARDARAAKPGREAAAYDRTVLITILAVLNLLFVFFLIVQAAALLGGEAFIRSSGITYASYARSGFFQLLTVSGIVFVIVMLIYRSTHLRQWGSRILSVTLIVETGAVIGSAVHRLLLYINEYGLTLSRFWAMAVIITIAAVLLAVLAGAFAKIEYATLAKGVLLGALYALAALLLANGEGIVARYNVSRFLSGETDRLDWRYLSYHSSDSLPALVSTLAVDWPSNDVSGGYAGRLALYGTLQSKAEKLNQKIAGDWRDVTVSDYRAAAALAGIDKIDVGRLPALYQGNLNLSFGDFKSVKNLPEEIDGDLMIDSRLFDSVSAKPKLVTGNVRILNVSGKANVPIDEIRGTLNVSGGAINEFVLPKRVGGDLDFESAMIRAYLPSGMELGGAVKVSTYTAGNDLKFISSFIADAKSKGYRVDVGPGLRYDLNPPPALNLPVPPCGTDENPCR